MKKICYVVTIPATIESFFIPQLKFLAESEYDVTVVCSNSSTLKNELGAKVKFHPIDIPRGISLSGSIKAIRELTRFFKKEKFDLIQYSTPNAAFYASIAAKNVGCRVRNYHMMGLRFLGASGIGRQILKSIEKITCNNSTSIECVSKSNLQMGIEEGLFSAQKAVVVWNGSTGGVDCKKFDYQKRNEWRKQIRTKLGYSEDDFVYGFVGRITRDKGINEMLEAFFSLEESSKLFLIGRMDGDSTLSPNLMEKARKHPDVKFHEYVLDIERYYAAIDVLLLPSYREGFGNVVIEAGAVGTPAIVTNIPGPIDTIDAGNTALTVEVKSAADLAEKMKKIREADYKTMGQSAARFAMEKFDSTQLYKKILERKQRLLFNGEIE